MKENQKSVPAVMPYLGVRDAAAAIEFYKQAFGAVEKERLSSPDGSVAHAGIEIGDSMIMLAEENPEWGNLSPSSLGGTTVRLHLYVDDVDAVFSRAIELGAKEGSLSPISSTAIDRVASRIRSAISGSSRPARRTSRAKRWSGVSPR